MSGTSDQPERTTATGLFHFAASYRAAADNLAGRKLAVTSIPAIQRTSRHLYSAVGHALRVAGEPVRLPSRAKSIGR